MDQVLIKMEGIDKSFPGVRALDNAQFELRAGEVHALVGENGAGKSTLMKVLAGIYQRDAGRIIYSGRDVEIPNPRAAQELGISMIHQELNLMNHLTLAQNVYIGREPRGALRFILDERRINAQTQELFDSMHLRLDPRTKAADLSVAKQQMVEIAKAISFNSQVLIMDEPTAALTDTEIEELFRIIRQLRAKGVGVVYISHRLEELKVISDRITVMRDGHYVDTVDADAAPIEQIISMMVGRTIYEAAPEIPERPSTDVVLDVRGLNRGSELIDINFQLKRGEILGFAGLMGAGRTEVARAIFGADPIDSGEITVNGKRVAIKSPGDAVHHGIGYLSEDRKRYGLALGMDVEANIVLASYEDFLQRLGVVNDAKTAATAEQYVTALAIKTPSIDQTVKNLSGGNQQKVVIGKWLARNCRVLIFDEPTRGVDIGARAEIYSIIEELAEAGVGILVISSDLPELLGLSDRVLVVHQGRLAAEFSRQEATPEKVISVAFTGEVA
ncbi:MAG: sugar ABC transporter ATP-binding protein [Caldilineaceae bacterium]|nr:sugar ABC transporter ATP-binding protein [Caldilineaceae bacterium]